MSVRNINPVPMQGFRPPDINFRSIGLILLVIFLLMLLWNVFFTVGPQEVGVIQFFGAYDRTVEPGLHFKFPFPIEALTKVPVEEQLKDEFGFRTVQPGVRTRYSQREYLDESAMLTGDLNVAVVTWETQFRISDPYRWLFRVRNVRETFRDLNVAVMREVVGDRSVDEVITIGREEIAVVAQERLQELCDQYETGVQVIKVLLQDVNPPGPVQDSFNEVNQAKQERERMINDAEGQYNRVVPRARGEALQTIQEAEGYATDRVNRARGDASRFDALRAAYAKAPEVTRRRIYLETMQSVLPTVERKLVLDQDLKGLIPLLSLSEGGKP
jgi:membrane protease subunit HflK